MRFIAILLLVIAFACLTGGCIHDAGLGGTSPGALDSSAPGTEVAYGSRGIAIAYKTDDLATVPEGARAKFLAGLTLSTQYGRYNDSLALFDEAIVLDPHFSGSWTAKAVALHNMKRFDEALRCYDRALELSPADASVWRLKGMTLEDAGRPDEAAACYRRAAELSAKGG